MASEYGLNFGFRVSDETRRVSNGRVKTPTGADGIIRIGSCVELDTPGNPGRLAVAAADAAPRPGICGLLLQEEQMFQGFYDAELRDSFDYGLTKPDTLSVITNGEGTKVWFRNTAEVTRGSRVIPAVTLWVVGTVAVGDQLGWDGTAWAEVNGTTVTNAHMEVTELDAANGFIEAVLL